MSTTALGLRPLHWPGMAGDGVVSAVSYRTDHDRAVLHRGMPSAWLTVVVSTDGEPVNLRGSVDRAPGPAQAVPVTLGGLQERAAWVEQRGQQAGVQLAIHPLAARALLGVPAAELPESGADGRDVLPALDDLEEQLASTPAQQQGDVLAHWIRERIRTGPRTEPRAEVQHAWRLVARARGRVRMDEVALGCHLSGRQLRDLVRRELGVGPKHLARLARFDHAVSRLASGVDPTLGATAAASGYADHSHFDAEFVTMVGCPPSAWLAEERRNIQDGGHRAPHTGDHD